MIKNRSIFLNLYLQYMVIIIVFFLAVLVASFNIIKKNYINNLKEKLESNSILIDQYIKSDYVRKDVEGLNKKINNIASKLNVRITIIDTSGKVLADSQKDYQTMENHLYRPEITEALNDGTGISTRYSSTLKLNMLYMALPIKNKGQIVGVNRISIWVKDINQIVWAYRFKILIILIILLFVALLFALYMSKSFTSPIKKISLASKKVAEGDFNVRLFMNNNREIKEFADNFNNMTEKLNDYFEQLNFEKEEFKRLVTSTKDGVIVINEAGQIIRANRSFLELFKEEEVINRNYWEIIRDADIINYIKSEKKKKNHIVKEIFTENSILLCSVNYLKTSNGYLLVFFDITELKNLETIKKDIVSNVSHELSTPLTAIKGFIETLLEDERDENKRNFLEIVQRNTERLINIVKDLLTLSNYEKDRYKEKTFEELNLDKLLKDIFTIFVNKAKNKNVKIEYNIHKDVKSFEADPYKVEQMFINLIDNAIKYTDKGKVEINISNLDEEKIIIEVKDTGIGIPEKDLNRIFERFYVVDKSRSKKSGGTGLGLSIVKHVVLYHNGEIKVNSKVNEGTSFSIILPKRMQS